MIARRYTKHKSQGRFLAGDAKLESSNYLHFQVDTGAQCNVVPLHLYKKATEDHKLALMAPVRQRITAYGRTEIPVIEKAILRVWRGNYMCQLDCKIMHQTLLGRKPCLGTKIIAYLDNDKLNNQSLAIRKCMH